MHGRKLNTTKLFQSKHFVIHFVCIEILFYDFYHSNVSKFPLELCFTLCTLKASLRTR